MKINLIKYLTSFLILIAGLFVAHFLAYRAFSNFIGISFQLLGTIYLFLLVLGVVHILAVRWLFSKWPRYAGFIFTGLSLVKMGISVLFLLPYLVSPNINALAIALNFMLIYLILLGFEVVFISKNMVINHQN